VFIIYVLLPLSSETVLYHYLLVWLVMTEGFYKCQLVYVRWVFTHSFPL